MPLTYKGLKMMGCWTIFSNVFCSVLVFVAISVFSTWPDLLAKELCKRISSPSKFGQRAELGIWDDRFWKA